jgi:hypothetical protein
MIVLTIAQFREKLPQILASGASVLVIGEPGVGKTYNAGEICRLCGPTVMVNGGSETDWKMLFPYRMPSGGLMLGTALAAGGWNISADGELVRISDRRGFIVIDEVNRVLAEMKSQFQLLGSDRAIEVPGATPPRRIVLDLAMVATANPVGLGVEEMGHAELDRWDLFIRLQPTPQEVSQIIAGTLPTADEAMVRALYEKALSAPTVTTEAAEVVYECVQLLASKLDAGRFHKPEGIRLAKAIGRVLPLGIFKPAAVFASTVERCFPLGRRGAERHRAEFDGIIADVAGTFASKVGALGGIYKSQPQVARAAAAPLASATGVQIFAASSLSHLREQLEQATGERISTLRICLPRRAMELLPQFRAAFGAGVALEVLNKHKSGKCERNGVKLSMADQVKSPQADDTIEFGSVEREKVLRFCSLVERK